MRLAILAVALVVTAAPAEAQYRRSPTDTVRLREVTIGQTEVSGPNGSIALRSEHDAVIAVAFGPADDATGWYEALRIAMTTPQGTKAPATDGALRQPFDLSFDAQGRIRTERAPTFPASFKGVTDLSHQFDDLFPLIPASPLAAGSSWRDSVTIETRGPGGKSFRSERRVQARVLRDTVVDGEAAWLVEAIQQLRTESVEPVEGGPVLARSSLAGSDTGIVILSRDQGRLLVRERRGTMAGTLRYEGGPQPLMMPLRQRYENRVTRVP